MREREETSEKPFNKRQASKTYRSTLILKEEGKEGSAKEGHGLGEGEGGGGVDDFATVTPETIAVEGVHVAWRLRQLDLIYS